MENIGLFAQRNVVLFVEVWLEFHARDFEDDNNEETNACKQLNMIEIVLYELVVTIFER